MCVFSFNAGWGSGAIGSSVDRQGLKPLIFRALNVTAEAVAYKDYL
jgi:hypothetical protein